MTKGTKRSRGGRVRTASAIAPADPIVDPADITDEGVRLAEVASRPRSEVTGRHDEGSGANETIDGLDELQEAVRHGAEDIPDKRTTLKDIPVFDRASVEPKV
ncbi:MAG: hypothetical protein QOG38_2636 [Hyphomicrobiales bacterium]|jgi:hypothetical protein|nr:hypothetical protein [Hyphomicrobiales bacterium]